MDFCNHTDDYQFESTAALLANIINQSGSFFAPETRMSARPKPVNTLNPTSYQYKIPFTDLYDDEEANSKMLETLTSFLYDIQDIGARTYTYISTLNYCMWAAKANVKCHCLDVLILWWVNR